MKKRFGVLLFSILIFIVIFSFSSYAATCEWEPSGSMSTCYSGGIGGTYVNCGINNVYVTGGSSSSSCYVTCSTTSADPFRQDCFSSMYNCPTTLGCTTLYAYAAACTFSQRGSRI